MRQEVDEETGGRDAFGGRLNVSRVRGQAIGEHGGADFAHLPVAAVGLASLRHTIERCRRNTQSFEQPAVEQSAVLAHQNRHTIECVDSDSFALLIAR